MFQGGRHCQGFSKVGGIQAGTGIVIGARPRFYCMYYHKFPRPVGQRVLSRAIPVAQFGGGGLHFNESVHLVLSHPAPPLPAPRGHMGPGVTPGGSPPGWK